MIEIKLGGAFASYDLVRSNAYFTETDWQDLMPAMTDTKLGLALAAMIFAVGLSATPARAQEKDLAEEGRMLAEQHCARCHAIDKADESELPEAPPFRTFAAKWPVESLEEALAEGIVTGHPDMPVFQFEPDQIAALLEHLTAIADAPKGQ